MGSGKAILPQVPWGESERKKVPPNTTDDGTH
jgi:hypothetical protein